MSESKPTSEAFTQQVDRLLGLADQFIEDWVEGAEDLAEQKEANERKAEWDAVRPKIMHACNSHAGLVSALEAAVKYLDSHRPKGKIRDIFHDLNEHENGVLKPARAALAQAKST